MSTWYLGGLLFFYQCHGSNTRRGSTKVVIFIDMSLSDILLHNRYINLLYRKKLLIVTCYLFSNKMYVDRSIRINRGNCKLKKKDFL